MKDDRDINGVTFRGPEMQTGSAANPLFSAIGRLLISALVLLLILTMSTLEAAAQKTVTPQDAQGHVTPQEPGTLQDPGTPIIIQGVDKTTQDTLLSLR